MKKFAFSIIPLFLFVISQNVVLAQQSENWLERKDSVFYTKLYLHTDREYYFQGDTIWFKAYYLDGRSQQLIPGFYNMFIDLVNEKGETISQQLLPIFNGVTDGNISIPYSQSPGNYILRAFTGYQKNFGEDAFFYKSLSIKDVRNPEEMAVNGLPVNQEEKPKIEVSFLPEGGFLLAGQRNTVGVKAIDETGNGISVEGEIIDRKGKVVAMFATMYKGMGRMYFTPVEGETYHVSIAAYPDFTYEFKEIRKAGIKLEYVAQANDNLVFKVTTNARSFQGKTYYFAMLNKGEVLFYQKFVQKKKDSQIKIKQSELGGGINCFVLLDEKFNPVSERLYFSKNYKFNEVKINLDQAQYETRSEVQLELSDSRNAGDASFSNLSVTVIDEKTIGDNGPSSNILSYLLINSELKGNIESPSDYFIDDATISSETKLNLLMLTQGWSNYLWPDITQKKINEAFVQDKGITVNGWVKRVLYKKPVVDGKVVLGLFTGEHLSTFETQTDAEGKFSFKNLLFNDTASIFVQARNDKGNLSTIVFLDSLGKYPEISKNYLPVSEKGFKLPVELYQQKYNGEVAMEAFDPAYGAIMLDEVVVNAPKVEKKDDHFRIYTNPLNSLQVTEEDYYFRNVSQYLAGRLPGVICFEDKINIHVAGSINIGVSPLYIVDGMPTEEDEVMNIPVSNIDKVEVLKTIGEFAIFGMRGGNGVISILLRKYRYTDDLDTYTKGAIKSKIVGYAALREFYSPKYTPENLSSKRPDNRLTLYWNPNIITEDGIASLSFFTSDDLANYKVFVEGITNDGTPCLGSGQFTVNEYNPEINKK